MKMKKLLISILFVMMLGVSMIALGGSYRAKAASADYLEQYRPQLSFSPKNNWNNDPNGLVYALGQYHMYYQYSTTGNTWDTMHWGHATSADLVHWTEQSVAINPNMPGWGNYDAAIPNGPIFSGSAVYVSSEDISNGVQAYNGAGFYAIFTQPNQTPNEGVGDQRQCIAYSVDGTNYEFSTFKEIIPNDYDDGSGTSLRGDFRDPKVFFDQMTNKWVMVVGGGEIVQFQSENLLDWSYVGSTTLWGECPDMFKLSTTDGDDKWVMVLSPEDKPQSHEFNNTQRSTTEYPNEYYMIGSRDENGLFLPDEGEVLKQLAIGIDSYAIQTFNGINDRRVGISWSASWKTVGDYALKGNGGLRDNWNGGMTLAYELGLKKVDGQYMVTKMPVSEYDTLRKASLINQQLTIGNDNALNGINSSLAEINLEIDVANSEANIVKLGLAMSKYEQTVIKYDIANQMLYIDRSESSLSAKNTSRYNMEYSAKLAPTDGKVKLRAYLDYGYLHVFGGDGEVSASVAIFPSLASNGMSLTADGNTNAKVEVYPLSSIWNNDEAASKFGSFYLSAKDEILNVGDALPLLASSPNSNFKASEVSYSVIEGGDVIDLNTTDGVSLIAKAAGTAVVRASYNGTNRNINVQVYDRDITSDLSFNTPYAGKWYEGNGYVGSSTGDSFIYSKQELQNFKIAATITANPNSQAAGIMFAASNNFHTFYCANYDYKDKVVKLWMAGGDTIASANLSLRRGESFIMEVTVINGDITIAINGEIMIETSHSLYEVGSIGLNVFNGSFSFNNITLSRFFGGQDGLAIAVGEEDFLVRNNSDNAYLNKANYIVEEGQFALNESYLMTLTPNTIYSFSIVLADRKIDFFYKTNTGASVMEGYKQISSGNLSVTLADADVIRVTLGGKDIDFQFERGRVIIGDDLISTLTDGEHILKIYTTSGALEYVFGYKFVPTPPINRTGAIISIVMVSIVLASFLGFVVYWLITSKKKNKING